MEYSYESTSLNSKYFLRKKIVPLKRDDSDRVTTQNNLTDKIKRSTRQGTNCRGTTLLRS